jgi:hypothetical protein
MFVTSYDSVDFTNLIPSKELRKDRKVIVGLYNKKDGKKIPHLHQSPDLLVTKIPIKKGDEKESYEMELPLYGKTPRKSEDYVKYLQALDNHVKSILDKNKEKWFEKELINNIMYKTIIRPYKQEEQTKFNLLGGIKIRFSLKGNDAVSFYDNNKNLLKDPISSIVPFKTYMKIIFHSHSILIEKEKCALVLIPIQIKLTTDEDAVKITKSYSFKDEDEEDEFNDDTCDNYLETEIAPEKTKEKVKEKTKESKEKDKTTEKLDDKKKEKIEEKKKEDKLDATLANKGKEIFIEHKPKKETNDKEKSDDDDDDDDIKDNKDDKEKYDEDGEEIDVTTSEEIEKDKIKHKKEKNDH